MKGLFEYRDYSNYRFTFESDIPKGLNLNENTTIEKLGFYKNTFFGEGNIVPYHYDSMIDHDIVTLIEIL